VPGTMSQTLGRIPQRGERRARSVALAGLVGLVVLGTATAAKADGDFLDNLKLEVGVMGGAHIFAHDLELGVADDPGLTTPKNGGLFGLRIGVVLHPQSVIHSFVEFQDGSLIAQLAKNDMKFPIVYALTYPERAPNRFGRLDLVQLKKLEFFEVESERYPAVDLALDALRQGGGMPAVLNGANEVAVAAFLQGKISFPEIVSVVAETAAATGSVAAPATLEEAEEIDGMARRRALEITHRLSRAAVAN